MGVGSSVSGSRPRPGFGGNGGPYGLCPFIMKGGGGGGGPYNMAPERSEQVWSLYSILFGIL